MNLYIYIKGYNVIKKIDKDILLVCTGAGNVIQGGADIWVNNFLKEVWPILPRKKKYKLLIDSKQPTNFEPSSLPKGLKYHFHFNDKSVTEEWALNDRVDSFSSPTLSYERTFMGT